MLRTRTVACTLVTLSVLASGCAGHSPDSAPPGETLPAAGDPTATAPRVDSAIFERNTEDLQSLTQLAEALEATAKTAISPIQGAQSAAEALGKVSEELKIRGKALSRVVDKAVATGTVKLRGIKKKHRDAVGAAVEDFVATVDGLKGSPQRVADTRAEFDRVEARAAELAAAIDARTAAIVDGVAGEDQDQAHRDRERATEIKGVVGSNLEAARGLVSDWEGHSEALAQAFDITLTDVKTLLEEVEGATQREPQAAEKASGEQNHETEG
ncbi:MAG: hypothetical protein V3V08_05955 [Nannocystaceae bacterium]